MATAVILVIDDRPEIVISAQFVLEDEGYQVLSAKSPNDGKDVLANHKVDLILLDMNFSLDTTSGEEGLAFLTWLQSQKLDTSVVAMTAWSNVALAVKAMQLGAGDFIEKPWKNQRLLQVIAQQLELSGLKHLNKKLQQRLEPVQQQQYQWRSPCMLQLIEQINRVAQADVAILLTGENGTGKSQLAQTIHQASGRASGPMISVNMGAISESLFESEMFGHKKGAFTDAKSDRIGRFELAQGGSLFLDEIANIPMSQQAKLLRVLESREFEVLGTSHTKLSDVRIISATNANCADLIRQDKMREDLFYRLNTLEFHLPPLRERQLDILPLSQHLLSHYADKYGKAEMQLDKEAEAALLSYYWPGNIRELSHILERAVLLNNSTILGAESLNLSNHNHRDEYLPAMTLEQAEKRLIQQALTTTQGNVTHAAGKLGITKSSLYRRLEKYDDIEK